MNENFSFIGKKCSRLLSGISSAIYKRYSLIVSDETHEIKTEVVSVQVCRHALKVDDVLVVLEVDHQLALLHLNKDESKFVRDRDD